VVQNTNNVLIFVGMSPMLRFVQGERGRDEDREKKNKYFYYLFILCTGMLISP
jgi:hypothetical protein